MAQNTVAGGACTHSVQTLVFSPPYFPPSLPWLCLLRSANSHEVVNLMGALVICVFFLSISCANSVKPVVNVERPVFYREKAARSEWQRTCVVGKDVHASA